MVYIESDYNGDIIMSNSKGEKMTVIEFLTNYGESKGWGTLEHGDLCEILTEGTRVHTGEEDVHRWYICHEVVNQVGEVFIAFTDYTITGDNNMYDMGLEYDLKSAKIVQAYERVITETYYE